MKEKSIIHCRWLAGLSTTLLFLATSCTGHVAGAPLWLLESRDGASDADGQLVESNRSQHFLCVLVDLQTTAGSHVESRDLGDVLVLALSLLLLKLEGDAADGSLLNALHEVCRVAGNLWGATVSVLVVHRTAEGRLDLLDAPCYGGACWE